MNNEAQKGEAGEGNSAVAFAPVTRRSFLARVGAAGVAIGTGQLNTAALADTRAPNANDAPPSDAATSGATVHVRLNVNGTVHDLNIDPRTTLLDCVRDHLHLTGTKKGC